MEPVREAPEAGPVYSRIVRVTVGQLVEIPFRGSGWVYLGELGSRRGIVYDSRRLDPEGQSFIFRAEAAGTYALKFYKQDFIRDYILNDYVQVIVGEAPESGAGWFKPPADRGRVTAEPRWPTVSEEAEARRQAGVSGAGPVPAEAAGGEPGPAAPAESPGGADSPAVSEGPGAADPPGPELRVPGITDEGIVSVVPPAAAGPPPVEEPRAGAEPPRQSPEEYLKKAREEFDAGRVASAISVLDQFREHFPSGSDEAWWLLGQFHEANSPSRDIRSALDYYRRLVREYPQSSRYNDARRRIAYLERFYINIQ
jgi:TolA-binding protein